MVKAGYKQTEVGEIPVDWDIQKFSDNFIIYAGGDVPKNSHSSFQTEKYCNPIYANAIHKRGLYGYTEIYRSKGNAITVTARGTIGHAEYRGEPFFPIVRLLVLEPNGLLNPRFATYAINDRVEFAIESTGVPQLTAPQIGQYSIAAPVDTDEQQAIADTLSDVDSLIRSLEALVAKKQDTKTATMQELLTGKKRLPGFGEGKGTKQTEIGGIPEDWDVSVLASVCTFENGDRGFNYPSKSDFRFSGVPFVNAGQLNNKKISIDDMDYITPEKYDQLGGGKFERGDILFCLRGSLGKFAVIKEENMRGAIASSLIIIRPINKLLDLGYLEFYLESSHCQKMIDLLAGGAAQPNLGGKQLGSFSMALPEKKEEQIEIAKAITSMDLEIGELEKRLTKTKAIKQGMMQELLTGRTRLV